MTDSSIYIEAEEKATKYDEILHQPLILYHTRLIHRLNKLLDLLKKQSFNEIDVEVLAEVYHLANDEIKKATNIQDMDAFIRISHEAKLILIEHELP
jgi:hypothetical protein